MIVSSILLAFFMGRKMKQSPALFFLYVRVLCGLWLKRALILYFLRGMLHVNVVLKFRASRAICLFSCDIVSRCDLCFIILEIYAFWRCLLKRDMKWMRNLYYTWISVPSNVCVLGYCSACGFSYSENILCIICSKIALQCNDRNLHKNDVQKISATLVKLNITLQNFCSLLGSIFELKLQSMF